MQRSAFKLCFQFQLAPLHCGGCGGGPALLRHAGGQPRAAVLRSLGPRPASHRGRAVQLDPIKPTSKVRGTKRLKLKYDRPLSRFALKFNLRRYTAVDDGRELQIATGHRDLVTCLAGGPNP